MDEEKLSTPPAPEIPEQPVEEPITEPASKEPVPEVPTEEQAETPAEPLNESTAEESTTEQPTLEPSSEAPIKPTDPADPALVNEAESETPVEPAPVFPIETNPQPKTKKPLIIAMVAFLILALGGTSIWYFLLRDKGTSPDTSIQDDIEPTPDLEPIPASKIALKGNDLSDFDLAFLHLENKQENIVYSPLSIKYALAMLADSANGQSKEQITAVIGDYQPKAYLNSTNRSLANAMFIRTDFAEQVKSSYKATLESKYNASVILDPFSSPDNANKWVEDKTLGIIKNTFTPYDINGETDYVLINALAIDMQWNYKIQCNLNGDQGERAPSKRYGVSYNHEEYHDSTSCTEFSKISFNDHKNTESAKVAASINRYNIISDKGEENVRETVQAAFDEWIASDNRWEETKQYYSNHSFDMDKYIEELSENFNRNDTSTDFFFNITDNEKIFAKDLKEYDGSTLQYVGIMPTTSNLNAYLNNLTAEKAHSLIASLKDPSDNSNFKQGVVTKLNGNIPFFKFDFTMGNFMENLKAIGIVDVFSPEDADLSSMLEFDTDLANKPYINIAVHKADIDFSNEGIKAGAVTSLGGMGAGGGDVFEYKWDVPVEEIDLTFDKPFLFLIRDKGTGEVWFVGTVYEGATAN